MQVCRISRVELLSSTVQNARFRTICKVELEFHWDMNHLNITYAETSGSCSSAQKFYLHSTYNKKQLIRAPKQSALYYYCSYCKHPPWLLILPIRSSKSAMNSYPTKSLLGSIPKNSTVSNDDLFWQILSIFVLENSK